MSESPKIPKFIKTTFYFFENGDLQLGIFSDLLNYGSRYVNRTYLVKIDSTGFEN
jgi:hypothetical protein